MFGHRIKASVLAGLIVLSTIGTLFIPPQKAYAAGTMLDTARGWSVLKATIDYSTNLKANPSKSDVDSCKIFRDDRAIGHHVSIDDGMWLVKSPPAATISSGLNAVGISGCSDLMTTLGYTLNGDTYNRGGSRGVNDGLDRNDVVSKLKAKGVEANLAGSDINSDTPSNVIAYAILYQILNKTCGWQYRNPYVDGGGATDEEKTRNEEAKKNSYYGDTSGQHAHTYTVENGKPGDNTYYKDGGNQDDIYLGPGTSGINMNTETQLDCADDNEDTVGGRLATRHQYADAYSDYLGSHPDIQGGFDTAASDSANSDDAAGTTTCGIKTAIGWILCPVTSFLAVMLDNMYEFISSKFLVVPSALFDTSNGTYQSWKIFRDYANIAFIIAFLMIVYSQVTSVGISNYGIKKLLPKLIIAAVLVNMSYYICQGLVELTNLLGYAIKSMFDSVSTAVINTPGGGNADTGEGGTVAGIITAALAGTAIVVIAVALGLIIPAIIAVGIVFIILLIRQALIVILIVLSPLAFVAWLLPNTEGLFKKWWGMLINTLMVFPIIAFLFGGAKLASVVLAGTDDSNITQLLAVGVATVPLFMVLPLLNRAIKDLPVLGKRLQNAGDRATGKISKNAATNAKKRYENSTLGRNRAIKASAKKQYKNEKYAARMGKTGLARAADPRAWMKGRNPLTAVPVVNRLPGASGAIYAQERLNQTIASQEQAHYEESVKSAESAAIQENMSYNDRLSAATTGMHDGKKLSDAERDAHIRYMSENGNVDERREVLSQADGMTQAQRRSAVNGARKKGDSELYGSSTLGAIEQNGHAPGLNSRQTLEQGTVSQINNGAISAPTALRDARTSRYVRDQAQKSSASKHVNLSRDINTYLATPQGRGVSSEVRGVAGEITTQSTTNTNP